MKRWSPPARGPSQSAYKSKSNTLNPYFKGFFISTENSDEEGPPDTVHCPASIVGLILRGVQCPSKEAIRHALTTLLRPTRHKQQAKKHTDKGKEKRSANTADGEALRARKRSLEVKKRARENLKQMALALLAPDIKIPIDAVNKKEALKRLKSMTYCVWKLQPIMFTNPTKYNLICDPQEVHDVEKYVKGLHGTLFADELWAVDTEYKTPKGVKTADQTATSVGMSNGVA
jgi:hypothetical protein